jgi:hypothetical protein
MAKQSEPHIITQQTREGENRGSQTSKTGDKGSQTSIHGNSGSTSSGSISHTMGEKDRDKSGNGGNQPSKEAQIKGGRNSRSGGKS